MTTPRIAPIDPPYSKTVQDAFDKIMPPGRDPLTIFRTFAHNPKILRRQMALGATLLTSETLPWEDRELVLLRTCARCGSEYEWGVHVTAYARPLGFSDEMIEATVCGDSRAACWDDRQRCLIDLADSLHDSSDVDDALWERSRAIWSEAQLLELMIVCGMYHGVSYVTNACRMELEPEGARFDMQEA